MLSLDLEILRTVGPRHAAQVHLNKAKWQIAGVSQAAHELILRRHGSKEAAEGRGQWRNGPYASAMQRARSKPAWCQGVERPAPETSL